MFTIVTILSKASLSPDSTFTVNLLVDICSVRGCGGGACAQADLDTPPIERNLIRCYVHKKQHLRDPLLIMASACHLPCFSVAHLALKTHHFYYTARKTLQWKSLCISATQQNEQQKYYHWVNCSKGEPPFFYLKLYFLLGLMK